MLARRRNRRWRVYAEDARDRETPMRSLVVEAPDIMAAEDEAEKRLGWALRIVAVEREQRQEPTLFERFAGRMGRVLA